MYLCYIYILNTSKNSSYRYSIESNFTGRTDVMATTAISALNHSGSARASSIVSNNSFPGVHHDTAPALRITFKGDIVPVYGVFYGWFTAYRTGHTASWRKQKHHTHGILRNRESVSKCTTAPVIKQCICQTMAPPYIQRVYYVIFDG